jgi:hypothetical protein
VSQEQVAAKDAEITGLHNDIQKLQDQLSSHLVNPSSSSSDKGAASPPSSLDNSPSKIAESEKIAETLKVELNSKEKAWECQKRRMEG